MTAAARSHISLEALLARETLQQENLQCKPLGNPIGGASVELMKLSPTFDGFHASDDSGVLSEKAERPNAIDGRAGATKSAPSAPEPHDILVRLPRADLVAVQPEASGWYAIFTIDHATKVSLDAFSRAASENYKVQYGGKGAFVSPFAEPTSAEKHTGARARLYAKVSEYFGRMLHSSFVDNTGAAIHLPGDEVLKVHAKPPLGVCSPTLHLMGYWHDKTKYGPLIYLLGTNTVGVEGPKSLSPLGQHMASPLGSPQAAAAASKRMLEIKKQDAFAVKRMLEDEAHVALSKAIDVPAGPRTIRRKDREQRRNEQKSPMSSRAAPKNFLRRSLSPPRRASAEFFRRLSGKGAKLGGGVDLNGLVEAVDGQMRLGSTASPSDLSKLVEKDKRLRRSLSPLMRRAATEAAAAADRDVPPSPATAPEPMSVA